MDDEETNRLNLYFHRVDAFELEDSREAVLTKLKHMICNHSNGEDRGHGDFMTQLCVISARGATEKSGELGC